MPRWEAFHFCKFFKNGYFVSQKWSGFRHFVGILFKQLFDNLSYAEVFSPVSAILRSP